MATRGPHQFAGSDVPGEAYFGPLPPHSVLDMRGYHHQPPHPFGMLDVPLGFLPGEPFINDADPRQNHSPRFPQVAQIVGRQPTSVYGADLPIEQSQQHFQVLSHHHQYEDLAGILGDGCVVSGNFSEASTSVASEQHHMDGTGSSRNSSLGEQSGPRLKFMCSFGGKILPRPGDGKLRYAGGETRIVSLRRNTTYADLMHKMLQLCGQPVYLKYQLPDEDLDALITVSSDEDLENMMEEYDRLEASEGSSRLRIFLFSPAENEVVQFSDPSESRSTEQVYVEAINGISETAVKRYNDAAIGANSSEVPVASITSRVPATIVFPASEGNLTVPANPSAAVLPTAVGPAVPRIPSAPVSALPPTPAFLHASQGIPSIIPDISAGFLDQPIKRPMAVLDGAYQMAGSGAPTPSLSHQQSGSQGSNGSPRVPYQETSRGFGNAIDQLYQFKGLQIGDPTVAVQGAVPISDVLNDTSYTNNIRNLLPLGGHQINHGAIYSGVDSQQVSAAPPNLQSLASQASLRYQRANLVQHSNLDSMAPHEQLLTTANLPGQMAHDFAAFGHLGDDGTSVLQPAERAFPTQTAVNPSVLRPVKTLPISPIGSAPASPRVAYKETVFTQTGVAQQHLAAIQGGPGGSAEQSPIGLLARTHLVSRATTSSAEQIANQQPIGPPTNVETMAQKHRESLMNPYAAGRIYEDTLTSALEAEGLIGHPGNKDGLRKMLRSKDEEMRRELQQTNRVEMKDRYLTSDQGVSNKSSLNGDVVESMFGKFGTDEIDSHEHANNEFDQLGNTMASEANGTMEPSAAIGQLSGRPNVDQVQNEMHFSGNSLLDAYTPSPPVQESLSSNSVVRRLSNEKFMDEVSANSSSPLSSFPLKMTSNAVSSQSLFLSNMEEGQLIGNLMSYLESNDNEQWSNKGGSDSTINLIGGDGHIKSSSGNMTACRNESLGSDVSNISNKGSVKSLIDEDVFVPSDSYGRTDTPMLSNDLDSSTTDPFAKLVASSYTGREAVAGNDNTHTGLMGTSGIFPFSQVQVPEVLDDKTLLPIYDSDSAHASENADCENEEIRENLEHVAKNVAAAVLQPVLYSSPTLSIQNWEDTLADSNLGGGSIKSNTSLNETHSEVKTQHHDKGVTFQLNTKEGDEDGVRTDELTNLATIAEAEAKGRGLQIIKYSDLEELRELGSGTFGTVYHGKWRGTDVAIKRIKSSCFTGRPSERERLIADFWQEACILEKLHHPNVVAFYGVVPDGPGGTLATVTEYMVNGSLKQVLQKQERAMDRRKRLLITMDAAFGMEYLHGKNIVHFDLKCENLLVNMRDPQRPICKVADLGLSKVKHKTMISGGVRGTLPWMAPELLNGSIVSEKVDVFSFGIVMWELLTGEEPYANMHYGAIIGGIASNTLRPPVPSWCDSSWKSLMERCWSADPEDRPSFTDIAAELRTMSSNLKTQAQTAAAASGS